MVLYLLLGKLLIFTLQKFPFYKLPFIHSLFLEGKLLSKLFECDFCLGCWIYFFLALVCKINFFQELGYIPIIFEFFTGIASSFVMYLLSAGWSAKFQILEIK